MFTWHPGKWFTSFVFAAACLVLVDARDSFAQPVSFGIKAGVPLTGLLPSGIGPVPFYYGSPLQAQTQQQYAIGPVMEIRLPRQFGLEIGVTYKRIKQEFPVVTLTGFTIICPDPPDCENGGTQRTFQSQNVSKSARSLDVPVALRYHFSLFSIRPYVEGGYSYNHISRILTPDFPVYNPYNPRVPQIIEDPSLTTLNRIGILFGSGVEFKLPLIDVAPGIRYVHYDKGRPNTADFLVGVTLNSNSSGTTKR
jgi:hypothetical protein